MSELEIKLAEYNYTGGSVGSGKTYHAMRLIAESESQNWLYVAPTKLLLLQIDSDMKNLDIDVERIDSDSEDYDVIDEVLRAVNNTLPDTGKVILITTNSFLDCVHQFKRKHHWKIVLDEAFEPIHPARIETKFQEVFHEQLDMTDMLNVVAADETELSNIIKYDEGQPEKSKELLSKVVCPSYTVELLKTSEKQISFVSYMNPHCLNEFNDVLFLSAMFEKSILYRLWKSQGVHYIEHPYFKGKLYNLHTDKGHLIKIGYLLNDWDGTSTYTFTKRIYDGSVGSKRERNGLVIHRLIEEADDYLKDDYLISYNNWVRAKANLYHKGGKKIPVISHGMNEYQSYHNMACLVSTNPSQEVAEWLEERICLTRSEVNQIYRIMTIYQLFGRTSIRSAEDDNEVVWLVASKGDADYLHSLFEGSKMLGKVGDMPAIPNQERWKQSDDWQKFIKTRKQWKRNLKDATANGRDKLITKWTEKLSNLEYEMLKYIDCYPQ